MTRSWLGILCSCLTSGCLGKALELAPEVDGGASDASVVLCAGKDCLGGACVLDTCQPLLIAVPEQEMIPYGIAVDPDPAGGVFYTTFTGKSVRRVEKSGSKAKILFAGPSWTSTLVDIQFDAHRLYFSVYYAVSAPVYAMHESGKTPIKLGDRDPQGAWFITFDDSYVYWANRDDPEAIVRAPKTAGERKIILQKTSTSDATAGIALDGNDLYYGMEHAGGGWIGKVNKAGGAPSFLTGAEPRSVRVEGAFVYWNEPTSVRRMKKDGTGTVETLETGADIAGIGLDGGYVYFTDESAGTLRRRSIDGSGTTETLATDQPSPALIAFDEHAVYWTNQAGGVMKLAK